jgi:hypothetical protein
MINGIKFLIRQFQWTFPKNLGQHYDNSAQNFREIVNIQKKYVRNLYELLNGCTEFAWKLQIRTSFRIVNGVGALLLKYENES